MNARFTGVLSLTVLVELGHRRKMDGLTLFGLLAVTAMLVFYALENRDKAYTLAFACACILASIYGFLSGAWPFGVIEAIWAGVAAHRWRRRSSI